MNNMDYKKLVGMRTVFASSGWCTIDTRGLLANMCFNAEGKVIFQVMDGDEVNSNGEAILCTGETIEFIGKIRYKAYEGSTIGIRVLLYDRV